MFLPTNSCRNTKSQSEKRVQFVETVEVARTKTKIKEVERPTSNTLYNLPKSIHRNIR